MIRRERGSGPVTALLLLGIMALIFAAGVTAVGGIASNEDAAAQHAADAAALAGAQAVVDELPTLLTPGFARPDDIADLIGGGSCLQIGRFQASTLANANGATLTSYCFNAFSDKVSASTRMNSTQVSGPPTNAGAEAGTTFDAGECRLDPAFETPTPSPTPSPTPTGDDDDDDEDAPPSTPPPPPPPPPPARTWVDCGFGHLTVEFDLTDLRFHFEGLPTLFDGLQPRLTK